jgi:hypothetical protein
VEDTKRIIRPNECDGQHRFHVAETFTVESEGHVKVCIVTVCLNCPCSNLIEHVVAKSGAVVSSMQKSNK